MRAFPLCLLLAALVIAAPLGADDLETYYERSGYERTPRYDDTVDFCKKLADASRMIHYTTFGTSPQGRDLPLVIVDKDGQFSPDALQRDDKIVLLVQAGIHAGEIDGKDAGLILLRDIAVRKTVPDLFDHVTVLFMPIFNVDGHERFGPHGRINQNGPVEMGWRVTAQGLNLNRDYLKAECPETQAWIRLFNAWRPDFIVDCHVTDGTDYQYVVTYAMDVHGNMAPSLISWTEDVFLGPVERGMRDAGQEVFPYVYLIDWPSPNPKGGIRSWVPRPGFSNGYCTIRNRPSLLVETHMSKDYKRRVTGTYEILKQAMTVLNAEYRSLKTAIAEAERYVAGGEIRNTLFPLSFAPTERAERIEFRGIDFDVVESDISGAMWYRFNGKPVTFDIPYFKQQMPTEEADLPEAYIVPREWRSVTDKLQLHGVELTVLDSPVTLTVDSYRFEDVSWQTEPYEGRHRVSCSVVEIREERSYPAGTIVIDMNQPGAQVAAHILEPKGPDSYVTWGYFDAIFEQKEYAEMYVMEKTAREMLAADDALRHEFEEKKKSDPEFAGDPRAILQWFYKRTPYWDDRKDVYPVGKIFGADEVRTLLDS